LKCDFKKEGSHDMSVRKTSHAKEKLFEDLYYAHEIPYGINRTHLASVNIQYSLSCQLLGIICKNLVLFINCPGLVVWNLLNILRDNNVTLGKHIKLIFLLIQRSELEDEKTPTNERNHSKNAVVPDEERIAGKRVKSLGNGGGDGISEESDGLAERSHVSRSLGVGILQRGDGSEDLGESDEDVATSLNPNVEWGWVCGTILIDAGVGVVATWRGLVDVVLDNGGPNHGCCCKPETNCDLLDGSELKAHLS